MNLECKQCGYENESQRVYCHNCGTKLDRSVLPDDSQKKSETPGAVRKRVRHFTSPGRFTFGRLVKMIFTAVLSGFVAAALIAAALPPHGVPAANASDSLDAPAVPYEIEDAITAGRPIAFSEDQLNAYLARAIRAKKSDSWRQYTRTFVRLKPRQVWTTIEYSLFNYPLFVGLGQTPRVEDGKLTANYVGGYIGRLPLHPALMPYLARPFYTLADALKREREMLGNMRAIEITEKKAVLIPGSPPSAPPTPPA